ncbi:hypothetical protein NOCARDAX2BIS_830005 [Nocardioides sp. AX2bis]|nr:hypothetical protein NOCARDAX2BIS_830005 [Nocardioides sp. AX2bis]
MRNASRSFGDWLSEWRATFLAASDRAPSTKALYGGLLERHARPQLENVPLARITPADLTRVRAPDPVGPGQDGSRRRSR